MSAEYFVEAHSSNGTYTTRAVQKCGTLGDVRREVSLHVGGTETNASLLPRVVRVLGRGRRQRKHPEEEKKRCRRGRFAATHPRLGREASRDRGSGGCLAMFAAQLFADECMPRVSGGRRGRFRRSGVQSRRFGSSPSSGRSLCACARGIVLVTVTA